MCPPPVVNNLDIDIIYPMERLSGAIERIRISRDHARGFADWLLNDLGWKNRVISPKNRLVHSDFFWSTRTNRLKGIDIDTSILEKPSPRNS